MSKKYVTEEPVAEPMIEEEKPVKEVKKKHMVKVTASRLNVRANAKHNAPIVKVIEKDNIVEVDSLDQVAGFYKIKDGYIMADFVAVQ